MNLSSILARRISDYGNAGSIGSKFRAKRIEPLKFMIAETFEKYGEVKIIDIGGTRKYWNIITPDFLTQYRVHITVVNLPESVLPENESYFSFVHGNACNLHHLEDQSFHIVHSNSVIEHVGSWQNMIDFAQEAKRLAPNLFVQTPYFWFPIEPHFMFPFFHWLPRSTRIALIMNFDLGNHYRSPSVCEAAAKLENYRLLDKKMLQALFPKAKIQHERFFGLTKSLIATHSG